MSKTDYPKWKYAAEGKSRIVHNEDEEAALEGGPWHDTPADVSDFTPPDEGLPPPEGESTREGLDLLPPGHTHRDRVEAQAKSLGVKFSKSTTTEELQDRVFKAGSA